MPIIIRPYTADDLPAMQLLWNTIVAEGNSFPQEEALDLDRAAQLFAMQSYTGVAEEDGVLLGLYILHPNNIGRCGHIANASYAVKPGQRGKRIGEQLVLDSMRQAAALGFRILQFNAVVATNGAAMHLYEKLGFTPLGRIPGGFRMKHGGYEDIIPYFITLTKGI